MIPKGKSAKKKESIAERAVRGALAGYIYSERSPALELVERPSDGAIRFSIVYVIPRKSIDTMLRRERAAERRGGVR